MNECELPIVSTSKIAEWLGLFFRPGDTLELRFLDVTRKNRTHAGWIEAESIGKTASSIAHFAKIAGGCYFTPQRLDPAVLSRSARGRFVQVQRDRAKSKPALTSDADVVERRYLVIDVDPERPADTCATDVEKAAALDVANRVRAALDRAGLAAPVVVDSGNGVHLYYRLTAAMPGGPADSTLDRLARLLAGLAARFDTASATIDRRVYNASRILKIPGTWSRKGKHTTARPHRLSKVVEVPTDWKPGELAEGPADWLERVWSEIDPTGTIRANLDAPKNAAPAVASADLDRFTIEERIRRARGYLDRLPGSIQGNDGSGAAYLAACAVVHGFAVPVAAALDLLLSNFNPQCVPEWSVTELAHKCEDAARKEHAEPLGYLLVRGNEGDAELAAAADLLDSPRAATSKPAQVASPVEVEASDVNESADDPYRIARGILRDFGTATMRTLTYWRGEFYSWDGTKWIVRNKGAWSAAVSLLTRRHFEAAYKEAVKEFARDDDAKPPVMGKVTRPLVSNVVGALEAETLLDIPAAPAWIRGGDGPDPSELVATAGGIVHLPAVVERKADAIRPASPLFFNVNAVDYAADLAAPAPASWLKFLAELWPDDVESVALLQEWFGYLLSSDTSQQKMLLLIGPKRSGKGTITAVIRSLVGPDNCCGPTLSGLAGPFGLAPLLGKSVAIVDDARLSGRTDEKLVGEKLMLISGESGGVTVERKHLDAVTCKIPSRFVVATNEIPNLSDSSGALASRWSAVRFVKSFYGKEDRGLVGRLLGEMPGIFLWAVDGWARLQKQGRFTRPQSAEGLLEQMGEVSSDIGLFVKDHCIVGPNCGEFIGNLYDKWVEFCNEIKRKEPGTKTRFGKEIHSVAKIDVIQKTLNGKRERLYVGIRLRDESDCTHSTRDNLMLCEEEENQLYKGVDKKIPRAVRADEGVDL
jgi:putative DNA primase/helicase